MEKDGWRVEPRVFPSWLEMGVARAVCTDCGWHGGMFQVLAGMYLRAYGLHHGYECRVQAVS